jgi:hypothetical protein
MIRRDSSLGEVAFAVCTALHSGGVIAVLSGGSAAAVFAPDAIQSEDLDFIVELRAGDADPDAVLSSLGYHLIRDHYEHPDNALWLEFPAGPLAVGRELITRWDTLRDGDRLLHIISPTDSCRDRLAGFLFWNDRGSLEQAAAVARAMRRAVDLDAVRRWCHAEGRADAYQEFERALRS